VIRRHIWYNAVMTIGITGPGGPAPRFRAVVGSLIAAIIFAIGLVLFWLSGAYLVDWMWFGEVGYRAVFWTKLASKAAIFGTVFVASAAVLWANGLIALALSQPKPGAPPAPAPAPAPFGPPPDPLALMRDHMPWRLIIGAAALVLALLFAWAEAGNWGLALRYLNRVAYGTTDPVFGEDVSFYLFVLPAYIALKNWLFLIVIFSLLFAATIYWIQGALGHDGRTWTISRRVIAHGSALAGTFFAVKAWSYWLARFGLLYDDNGVVIGAGFTSLHVDLPFLWLLTGASIAVAAVLWANVWLRSKRLPIAVLLGFALIFILTGIIPALFERFYVRPNELALERPYIERSIQLTRQAYNLHEIVTKPFAADLGLDADGLAANRATIDNIRLWDRQPLADTYAQLQEIRTYYRFEDLHVDRYWLGGTYQSVILSAREMRSALLPTNAQTWVNLHLLFTHGNGAVMSPVTRKSGEGLPLLYLRDIPPVADGGPPIREPRIYFGRGLEDYVLVKTSTPEFDYPKGQDNVFNNYDGGGGVPVGSTWQQILFANYFSDLNLLLSNYITADSRIVFRRDIQERIHAIAPFLMLDHDPYLVVSEGRLFWIQDAYTTSRYFPYAQPAQDLDLNYIRNSVKIVVDAYNGSVDFYLVDPADPVAATYQRIFPDLFKPFAAMPADLKKHVRYPEDLFLVQARIYQTFHMESPDVFYNREDLWQFPRQPAGRGATSAMVPYFIIMRLPGETQAEFFLMIPMVPSRRDNMIAWLAARCDAPDYGKLIVYEFPKEKLVYGPFQIEARINQNTEISQQISLWNQMGSRVIRGNLLVIPIENSILYVSPLYLRAEQGHLPELKRVIAAYGEHVVMKETLTEALAALFPKPEAAPSPAAAQPSPAAAAQAGAALDHYERAMERLKAGDWAGFGAELDAMRDVLQNLNGNAADRGAPPTR
jgi:uncharacterized protein